MVGLARCVYPIERTRVYDCMNEQAGSERFWPTSGGFLDLQPSVGRLNIP